MLTGYGQFPEAPSLRDKIGKDLSAGFSGSPEVAWRTVEDRGGSGQLE